MIIVQRGVSSPFENRALKSMFEERKRVFVDLLGWDVPVIDNRFEVDRYDDEHALYVIVADQAGEHLGSARLLQTTRPHILADLYPDLCIGDVPRGIRTLEITRFCLARSQRSGDRRHIRNLLVSALVSVALEHDVDQYTGVAELGWMQQILAFGWDCRPLGLPRRLDCGVLGALSISINGQTPQLLARNGIWSLSEPGFARAA